MVALLSFVGVSAAPPPKAPPKQRVNIMSLPPFERAIAIIKRYETIHQLRHKPYYGYGHRILPGEKLPQHRPLTEKEADRLLRKDLRKFMAYFKSFRPSDQLLLGVLAYNIGPGAVQKSTVYKKLKRGCRDIYQNYVAHCRYKGKFHRQLHERRCIEFAALFVK